MKRMLTDEMIEHMPTQVTDEDAFWIENVALPKQYLFYWTDRNKKRYGYCSKCHKEYAVPKNFTQGANIDCKACGSELIAFRAFRKRPIDDAYVTLAVKSPKDPDVLVFLGIYAYRDYRESFRDVHTRSEVMTLNVFKAGFSTSTIAGWFGPMLSISKKVYFGRMKSTTGRANAARCTDDILLTRSVEQAVSGSPFRYMPWKGFERHQSDIVRFFGLAAKYPAVEYLVKLGFERLVFDAMFCGNSGAVNLRGKTIDAVLGVHRHDVKGLRTVFISSGMDSNSFMLWKQARKAQWDITKEETERIASLYLSYKKIFQTILKLVPMPGILNYIDKQKTNMPTDMRRDSQILTHWSDYLDACRKLNMDLSDASICRPKNLSKAHDKTIERIHYVEDKALNDKIDGFVSRLNRRYGYKTSSLILRPVTSTMELIREGTSLRHCVGGYAARYANGETVILVIRRLSSPGKPYFTVEVRGDMLIQCRGMRNAPASPDVQAFLDEWKDKKLKKPSKKKTEGPRIMVAV